MLLGWVYSSVGDSCENYSRGVRWEYFCTLANKKNISSIFWKGAFHELLELVFQILVAFWYGGKTREMADADQVAQVAWDYAKANQQWD